jgi:hypothetical protein
MKIIRFTWIVMGYKLRLFKLNHPPAQIARKPQGTVQVTIIPYSIESLG